MMGFLHKLFRHSPKRQLSKDVRELRMATTRLFDLIDQGIIEKADLSSEKIVFNGEEVPKIIATIDRLYKAGHLLGFEKPPGLNVRNLAILIGPGLIISVAIPLLYPNVRDPSLWLITFGRINTNPIWILSGVAYYVGVPTICIAAAGAYYYLEKRNKHITVG